MSELVLYNTEGCHLCEQAKSLVIASVPNNIKLIEVDIVDDDTLYQEYHLRIPVLMVVQNKSELGWPFNQEQLMKFIANLRKGGD